MEISERLNRKIKVGETYKNRDGILLRVVSEIPITPENKNSCRFEVATYNGEWYVYGYSRGYFVNEFGGFGDKHNHRDLIELVDLYTDSDKNKYHKIIEILWLINVHTISPIEALLKLNDIKKVIAK